MSEFAVYRPHSEQPAQAMLRSEAATGPWQGLHAQRFEVVSRGDFVPGILYLPGPLQEKPAPLLLLLHGTSEGMDADVLGCAAPWVKRGLAVATIDLPLHGERSSPKLSERLVQGVGQLASGPELDAETRALVEEFARQATSDLIRTLDALAKLPSIDGNRIGFMGFSLGAVAGSYLLANDPRPRASVLVGIGGGRGPKDLDPATYLAKTSNTSMLIVASEDDEVVSTAASDALFDAALEPKDLWRFSGDPRTLSEEAREKIGGFLFKELGL
jgi:dienelactone hydrolase